MSNYSSAMNNSTAKRFGGAFAAPTSSAVILIAGIAMAMSVIFFLGNIVLVRLCIMLVLVSLISLIALIVHVTPAQFRMR